jgi:hypothetical protein
VKTEKLEKAMFLNEMPGYLRPTIAIFPFPWYENLGRWMMSALKIQPDNSVKWERHFIDNGDGHAKAEVYDDYGSARFVACEFNQSAEHRIDTVIHDEELRHSLLLKMEKEITAQQRLADEEHLMLKESIRRSRGLPVPDKGKIILPKSSEDLLEALHQQLCILPKLSIVQLDKRRITLVRKGNADWTRVVSTNKTTGRYYFRDRIASGFGLSGDAHWGKTKAEIRAMLLPRANQLLQLASVKRMLAEALANGRRVVVAGGFVFWHEDNADIGWIVKSISGESEDTDGRTIWHEGTIISKNHGRIVVLPYIKESGEKVQGHTKNAAHDGKALPRHRDEYLQLPFQILDGDLMIGLFGELNYD